MQPFKEKIVGATNTLGDRFRRLREEAGLTIDVVAERINVQAKHLLAIEQGRYPDLPGPVYAKNFVRAYAKFLEVREETALSLFDREYAVAMNLVPQKSEEQHAPSRILALLTPKSIRRAIILLLALSVLIYLSLEVRNLTSAPSLVITSPADQATTSDRSIELVGATEPEVSVTANEKPILVDRQGRFQELLDLQDGLNTIIIRATKKHGKATVVIRKILVQTQ